MDEAETGIPKTSGHGLCVIDRTGEALCSEKGRKECPKTAGGVEVGGGIDKRNPQGAGTTLQFHLGWGRMSTPGSRTRTLVGLILTLGLNVRSRQT